uniref:Uncharacterized protein n=1 Tax=Anopheles coluzzii TaxID=1518534 RepID=A0A8W7P1N1_ANOCL
LRWKNEQPGLRLFTLAKIVSFTPIARCVVQFVLSISVAVCLSFCFCALQTSVSPTNIMPFYALVHAEGEPSSFDQKEEALAALRESQEGQLLPFQDKPSLDNFLANPTDGYEACRGLTGNATQPVITHVTPSPALQQRFIKAVGMGDLGQVSSLVRQAPGLLIDSTAHPRRFAAERLNALHIAARYGANQVGEFILAMVASGAIAKVYAGRRSTIPDAATPPRVVVHADARPGAPTSSYQYRCELTGRLYDRAHRHQAAGIGERAFRRAHVDCAMERIGRSLARTKGVEWKEYWAFLGAYQNLSDTQALAVFERYLERQVEVARARPDHDPVAIGGKQTHPQNLWALCALRNVSYDASTYPLVSRWQRKMHTLYAALLNKDGADAKSPNPIANVGRISS